MADTEQSRRRVQSIEVGFRVLRVLRMAEGPLPLREIAARAGDRKSTRLNSSHVVISYAVFCLKKKKAS